MPSFIYKNSSDKIYASFFGKDKNNDDLVEFLIKKLPENRFKEALELYKNDFLPDEAMCVSKNIHKSANSINAFYDVWMESFQQNLSVGCFKGDELVGVNCLVMCSKDANCKEQKDYKDDAVRDVFEAVGYSYNEANIFEKYNCDRFLGAYGLVVNKNYRGRGIATEIIKARIPLMKEIGLNVTATAFSVFGSQQAAKNAGFEDVYVISYEDFKKIEPRFTFTKTNERIYKVMAMKI
ncbi:hypothetical protein PVAND_013572 [Polypedilum vanderplanki]|uniref:N-acetyltransferase domain-containing protein n=1 Tax=Polypedilum vanderplanki TaxID=319348 RepID=A0A9J6CQ37_POLVA|nr:hypothetical protein PVAND_013572 [Polypedilum vanderplanki]